VSLLGERGKFAPFGVNGGRPGALNRFTWDTDEGEASPPLASKVTGVRIAKGQKVRLETPGGGGWEDPALRPRDRVERDVRLGYIAAESAGRDYGAIAASAERPTSGKAKHAGGEA
jgi:N-methylhydantoinase B